MNHSHEIIKIIEGALKLDRTKVISYTDLLASKLTEEGETKLAERLRSLITTNSKSVDLQPLSLDSVLKVPLDQESRLSMAEIIEPGDFADEVILNPNIQTEIDRFFTYYQNTDKLISKGLNVPNTMLLYGPPGSGKTKLAKLIGARLGLKIVLVRLDSVISSFLGSTSKNIRAIFDYANRVPCILLFDEFDAIAKVRDDTHELGELKRVVNSLLQNMDLLNNGSIVIAATNHEHLLDPAVWRRFYFKLKIAKPDLAARKQLIQLFLKADNSLIDKELELLSHLFNGMTGAEIEELCNKVLLDAVIKDEPVDLYSIATYFFDYINILTPEEKIALDEREIEKRKVDYLRKLDEKIFSYHWIAKMVNCSKSQVGKLIRGEV